MARVQIRFDDVDENGDLLVPSRTKQSFKKDCDINLIMARYAKTGVIDHVKTVQGRYGDFSEVKSYREAMDALIAADDAFMSLPSQVRTKFSNDVGAFLDFVGNPDNLEEMVTLGLAKPKPVSQEVVSQPSDGV